MSWPVPNTLMIEPTESESKSELDRFISSMISIRQEIDLVIKNDITQPRGTNILNQAPHPLHILLSDNWNRPYSRSMAAYPLPFTRQRGKFWPTTERLDDAFGDRYLQCTCPPMSEYEI